MRTHYARFTEVSASRPPKAGKSCYNIAKMSLWIRILEGGKRLFDPDMTHDEDSGDPEDFTCAPDPNDVGFTAAVVGLGAKLAKADGVVSRDEIESLQRRFMISDHEVGGIARICHPGVRSTGVRQGIAQDTVG